MASNPENEPRNEEENFDQFYGLDDPDLDCFPIDDLRYPDLMDDNYDSRLYLNCEGEITIVQWTPEGHLITNPQPPLDWMDEEVDLPPVPPLRRILELRLRVMIETSAESDPSVVAYNLEHLSRVDIEFTLKDILPTIGFPNALNSSDNIYFADSCLLPWVMNAPFPFFTRWEKAKEVMIASHFLDMSQGVASSLSSETPSVDRKLHFRLQFWAQQNSIKLCLMASWEEHPQDVLEADAKFVSDVKCWLPDGLMRWREYLVPIPMLQVSRIGINQIRLRALTHERFRSFMSTCYLTEPFRILTQ